MALYCRRVYMNAYVILMWARDYYKGPLNRAKLGPELNNKRSPQ